ncbi:hypothetical protein L210DRAFT_3504855 [Boletus edulis BED1]|uniref:Uncharacterized protein n=1 Tax=Boletus edulis BED1 TaxID=1328754 RepID=A0AAD4BSB8_BOLED|nr:hypothetical protein L210DRAFT_3504855 [Boletus edulis BED1]
MLANYLINSDTTSILFEFLVMLAIVAITPMMPRSIISMRELYDRDIRGRWEGIDTAFGTLSQPAATDGNTGQVVEGDEADSEAIRLRFESEGLGVDLEGWECLLWRLVQFGSVLRRAQERHTAIVETSIWRLLSCIKLPSIIVAGEEVLDENVDECGKDGLFSPSHAMRGVYVPNKTFDPFKRRAEDLLGRVTSHLPWHDPGPIPLKKISIFSWPLFDREGDVSNAMSMPVLVEFACFWRRTRPEITSSVKFTQDLVYLPWIASLGVLYKVPLNSGASFLSLTLVVLRSTAPGSRQRHSSWVNKCADGCRIKSTGLFMPQRYGSWVEGVCSGSDQGGQHFWHSSAPTAPCYIPNFPGVTTTQIFVMKAVHDSYNGPGHRRFDWVITWEKHPLPQLHWYKPAARVVLIASAVVPLT